MTENDVTSIVIEEAIQIHRRFGPGLLESVYEALLEHRLTLRGLRVKRQWAIPLCWDGITLHDSFRADLIVEDQVILEIKAIDALADVHFKQLLTYLRVSDLRVGLLINFNEAILKKGIRRVVNNYVEPP